VAFGEAYVEADGFRIRYVEAGMGPVLVHLHGVGGVSLTPAHDLLSRRFRVVAFEMPGFGESPENTRTESMPELASTMAQAVAKLGIDTFNLLGTSFGGTTALWLTLQTQTRVLALVLEAPAAIRPDGAEPPSGTPKAQRLVQRLCGTTDRPEAFVEVVADFLERHEAFVINRTPTLIHP
jgi:pimeloyl-ACP methyl ester carboxylesterase